MFSFLDICVMEIYQIHLGTQWMQRTYPILLEIVYEKLKKFSRMHPESLRGREGRGQSPHLHLYSVYSVLFAPWFLKSYQIKLYHFFTVSIHEINSGKKFQVIWRWFTLCPKHHPYRAKASDLIKTAYLVETNLHKTGLEDRI